MADSHDVAWWQSATLPAKKMALAMFRQGSLEDGTLVDTMILIEDGSRKPTLREVTVRGAILTAAIIGVWLIGSIAVRAILRRRRSRTG